MDNLIEEQYEKLPVGRAQDLTGKTFGKWTVLYRIKSPNSATYWLCECNCPAKTIKPVGAKSLLRGTSTNCGCERFKTIYNIADLKIHKRDENNNILLKKCFRCNEWLPLSAFWKNKRMKDGYSNECKNCYNTSKESRYNIYKKNAKKRNFEFSLTKEQFYNLTSQPCYYCGESESDYRGVDRINSKEGYTKENCVPSCTTCNRMKSDYDINFWYNHMQKILNYKGKNENGKD